MIYQHFWKNPDDQDQGLVWIGVRSKIAKTIGFSGDSDIPPIRTSKSGRETVNGLLNIHVVQASGRKWIAIYPDGTEYPFKASPLVTRKMLAQIASRWKNPPLALKPPKSPAFMINDVLSGTSSHVYLVELLSFCRNGRGESYFKIGKAKHIPKRIKQFGPCKIIASAVFPSERESLKAEKAIHSMYIEHRLPDTEIFRFNEQQVESVMKSILGLCDGELNFQATGCHSRQIGSASYDRKNCEPGIEQQPSSNTRGGQAWAWHSLYWKDLQAKEKGCIWVMPKGDAGKIFGINGDPDIPGLGYGPVRRKAAISRGNNWLAYHHNGIIYTFKASPMATKKIMAQIASRWLCPPVKLKPPDKPPFRLHDLRDETYSYVYFVRLLTFSEDIHEECYYKIGKSNEIPRRIQQFGPCELVMSMQLDTDKDALQAEKAFHKAFSNHRCPDTEIFRLDNSQVADVCELFKDYKKVLIQGPESCLPE